MKLFRDVPRRTHFRRLDVGVGQVRDEVLLQQPVLVDLFPVVGFAGSRPEPTATPAFPATVAAERKEMENGVGFEADIDDDDDDDDPRVVTFIRGALSSCRVAGLASSLDPSLHRDRCPPRHPAVQLQFQGRFERTKIQ